MLRVTYAELERTDFDVYILDFENRASIFPCIDEVDNSCEARPSNDDIGHSRVHHLWEACLLVEEEGDVAHVCLNLSERERKLMVMLIRNSAVWAELEVVMSDQGDNVREKIATLEGKILENEVQRIVGIFDTWNWKVPDLAFL